MVPAIRQWYLASVLRYEGSTNGTPLWSVGFLCRKAVLVDHKPGIKTCWEWVENLTWEQALELQNKEKPSLVCTSSGELRRALANA